MNHSISGHSYSPRPKYLFERGIPLTIARFIVYGFRGIDWDNERVAARRFEVQM